MLPTDRPIQARNQLGQFANDAVLAQALREASEHSDFVEEVVPTAFQRILNPKRRAYLIAQCVCPSKRMACHIAGVDTRTEYNWRMKALATPDDPDSKEWLAACDMAVKMGIEAAEHEAWERATLGWEEPVYGNVQEAVEIERADGKGTRVIYRNATRQVGSITKKSDTMLIFMLKGAKPDVYRERYEHTGPDGMPLQLQILLPDNGRQRRLPSGESE